MSLKDVEIDYDLVPPDSGEKPVIGSGKSLKKMQTGLEGMATAKTKLLKVKSAVVKGR